MRTRLKILIFNGIPRATSVYSSAWIRNRAEAFFLPCSTFLSLPLVTMPIAGAHAVAGACLHFTAARDKLPEMLFAGNMVGGRVWCMRAPVCARPLRRPYDRPPWGGGAMSHRLLDKVGRFTDETCIFFPKTILTISYGYTIIETDGTCENIVPTKERPQKTVCGR